MYETQDRLLSLLDELDWEAFGLRTKHEDGYAVHKCLVEGINFHQDNPDRQKRLAVARKAANEKESGSWKRKSLYGKQLSRQAPPVLRGPTTPPHAHFGHHARYFDNSSASGDSTAAGRRRGPRYFNCDQYGHFARDCGQLPKVGIRS